MTVSFNSVELAGVAESAEFVASETQPQPCGDALGSRRNVLVLEDDVVQLQLLTQHLQALSLHVVPATTIAEATQRMHSQPLHLAILDIGLPDGSGLDFCEVLDTDSKCSGLPIVVLSSLTQNEPVRQTRAAGGCFFIGKPYDPNVLLTVIERALGTELQ